MPSPLSNYFIKTLINSRMHALLGASFAVISVTGRKTGRPISTPVNTVCIEGDLSVISLRSRTWWRNLRGGCVGQLRQAGRTFPVQARIVEQPALVTAWLEKYFNSYPGHAKYFKLQAGADGKPTQHELERAAADRVIIHLSPA
jgi:deazaflavin-dependent oxidoreductase (nitroreductase family)